MPPPAQETFEDYCSRYLHERLMLPGQIAAVIAAYKADKDYGPPMAGFWSKPVSDYEPQVATTMVINLEDVALEWIKANSPHHVGRALFKDYRKEQAE